MRCPQCGEELNTLGSSDWCGNCAVNWVDGEETPLSCPGCKNRLSPLYEGRLAFGCQSCAAIWTGTAQGLEAGEAARCPDCQFPLWELTILSAGGLKMLGCIAGDCCKFWCLAGEELVEVDLDALPRSGGIFGRMSWN